MKDRKRKPILITCDYCGNIFLSAEPFCPICGRTPEEIMQALEQKKGDCNPAKINNRPKP